MRLQNQIEKALSTHGGDAKTVLVMCLWKFIQDMLQEDGGTIKEVRPIISVYPQIQYQVESQFLVDAIICLVLNMKPSFGGHIHLTRTLPVPSAQPPRKPRSS
eukprot:XP_011418039.1 PREDICTED: uncharacterized protein LOC105321462 [Crassostrea gigas]